MTRPLLVLRPEPGASRTAAGAAALGITTLSVPLFEVGPLAWSARAPQAFDALMITSANTLRHAGTAITQYRALPAYAVGAATAEAMRAAGFENIHVGPGDAIGLIARLRDDGIGHVLHLCGADRREPETHGIAIERIAVYEARAIDRPAGLAAALAQHPVAMLHSPRAAARFAELVQTRQDVVLAAISRNAADAAGKGWARVEIAAAPDDQALLAIAAGLCKQVAAKSKDGSR